jgi:hypothetical protein
MAKPVKYPRKLRHKLEKIASAREEREALAADIDRDLSGTPFNTFYRSFLPTGSVHTMLARVDDVLQRIEVTSHMAPPPATKRAFVRPPWEGEAGTSS